MYDDLEKLIADLVHLNSKLVLLIGPPKSGKTALLKQLSERRNVEVLNIGATVARRLLLVPSKQRHLHAAELLRDVVDQTADCDLLLVDNIELLFDRTLKMDPLDLLKRHAHARRVVASWPGELRNDRLTYATSQHPEHQDYGTEGVVPFLMH